MAIHSPSFEENVSNCFSGSGKTNASLNLLKDHDSDKLIDKIYLYARDINEPKYQFLIKKREDVGIKNLKIQKHLKNVLYIWMMFTITFMITIQIKKGKF